MLSGNAIKWILWCFADVSNVAADMEHVDISVKLEIIDIISDILFRYGSLFTPYLRGVSFYYVNRL